MSPLRVLQLMLVAAPWVAGCSDVIATSVDTPALARIQPASGAIGVSPAAPITIEFTHSMMAGTETYVALHEGNISGPTVATTVVWSADRRVLTITPASPLKPGTTYAVHLGGGMRDAQNRELDHGACAQQGGMAADRGMMGGSMMGSGWRHSSGSYGMVFTFTTA